MEKENELKQPTKKRKGYFRLLKQIMKIRYKEPRFVYLGEKFGYGGVILSNHEGTDAPMSIEIWNDAPTRMWGAHEMNSGLVKLYKYQTRVYYHEKKHWNLHLARLFCLIASPLTNLFYKGLNLISTYKDQRFIKTVKETEDAVSKLKISNEGAEKIYAQLSKKYNCEFDDRGNIGKRYRRQDEIGTPLCITVDFQTVGDETTEADNCVTVRDRDTMEQVRLPIDQLVEYINKKLEF